MKLIFCLIFWISSIGSISSDSYNIYNYNITSGHTRLLSRFFSYPSVSFRNSSLPAITAQVLKHPAKTVYFGCSEGVLEVFEIIPRLEAVVLISCQTKNVTIELDGSYELRVLSIAHCDLQELPKNLGYLTKLERLYIADTPIEHVELDEFMKLVNLEFLHLIDNKIKTIRSTTYNLIPFPKLVDLDLSRNNISIISFAGWDAPLLEEIYLRNNGLRVILLMPFNFPMLNKLDLSNNSVNCLWPSNLRQSMQERKVELLESGICGL